MRIILTLCVFVLNRIVRYLSLIALQKYIDICFLHCQIYFSHICCYLCGHQFIYRSVEQF